MKKHLKPTAAVLWIIAAMLFIIYARGNISSQIYLTPRDHVFFSAAVTAGVYLGGRFFNSAYAGHTAKIMRGTIWILFLFYLFVLLILTLFDTYYGREGISHLGEAHSASWLTNNVNMIPFKTIKQYIRGYKNGYVSSRVFFCNLFGNAAAFIPFALFLPLLFNPLKKFRFFAPVTAGSVVIIELMQLVLLTGSCDIDDFILNTAGAFVAFGIFHIPPVKRLIRKITVINY